MNERLTELYRSCRPKEALASQDQFQSADVLLGTEVEKFAELIIRECAAKADLAEPFQSSDLILKHFGVE
jgi:hypothetical protein